MKSCGRQPFGNLLTSPFAVAFLDSVLPGGISRADRDFSRMFQVHYAERALGRTLGEASRLLGKLRAEVPDRFHKNDRALIHLLSELGDPAFSQQMDSLAAAYRQTGDFHPEISLRHRRVLRKGRRVVATRRGAPRHRGA